jgi:hypothetical protein
VAIATDVWYRNM